MLEVDHIVPVCNGGLDDQMNLTTSCWDCNRGKSGIPLSQIMTGEDPHDSSILLLEKRRQLEEYNQVLREDRDRRNQEHDDLMDYWNTNIRRYLNRIDSNWIMDTLRPYQSK